MCLILSNNDNSIIVNLSSICEGAANFAKLLQIIHAHETLRKHPALSDFVNN